MDKFLSDQRLLAFLGAVLLALGGWGNGFQHWNELFATQAIFGLFGILGALLLANVTHNVWQTPPIMTEVTTPKTTTTVITSTPKEEVKP
jgi:hypothetical protein